MKTPNFTPMNAINTAGSKPHFKGKGSQKKGYTSSLVSRTGRTLLTFHDPKFSDVVNSRSLILYSARNPMNMMVRGCGPWIVGVMLGPVAIAQSPPIGDITLVPVYLREISEIALNLSIGKYLPN